MKKWIEYIFRAYRYRYKLDVNEISYIINNINKGDIVVDIGAHKGGYLYWMKKKVKQKGKVYAFEPQEELFLELNELYNLKKANNLTIENLGVSNEESEVEFFIPKTTEGNSPGARITCLDDVGLHQKTIIKTTTLDQYFLKHNIHPNFIKIDVEGHEKNVLLGGVNLIKLCKPKILIECENRHLKEGDIFDVFQILFDLGYSGYFFENRTRKSINNFKVDIHQKIRKARFWQAKEYINNFIFEPTIIS